MEDQDNKPDVNGPELPQPADISLDDLLQKSQLQRSVLQKLLDQIPGMTGNRHGTTTSSSENH
jgi:hypothetical protein